MKPEVGVPVRSISTNIKKRNLKEKLPSESYVRLVRQNDTSILISDSYGQIGTLNLKFDS